MIRVHEVPTRMVLDFWPVTEPMLAKAARHHPFADTECMLARLLAGEAQMFVLVEDGIEAVLLTEVIEYPNGRNVGQVWAMGGLKGIWKRGGELAEKAVEAWCRRFHCDTIAVVGRPGWRRLLRHFDSQPLAVAWRKLDAPTDAKPDSAPRLNGFAG